jgi:DNA-directed RNA polymerase specialized sigma24 family protein
MSIETDVAEQRGYLLKFARLQLRNEAWAEDAVSETLLAALAKPQAFSGRAQLRTWLVGILKHKVSTPCAPTCASPMWPTCAVRAMRT